MITAATMTLAIVLALFSIACGALYEEQKPHGSIYVILGFVFGILCVSLAFIGGYYAK